MLVRLFFFFFLVKFHVEIFETPLFQNGTPIFQMGLLFLEKEESRTPTFEIQVRTLTPLCFSCQFYRPI